MNPHVRALPDLSVQSFAACEVGPDTRLVGAAVDTDTAYLVLAGTLHLTLPHETIVAQAGSLVLVPAGRQPSIASSRTPAREWTATRERLAERGGMLVFDAAGGAAGELRVMVGRVRGELMTLLADGAAPAPLTADLRRVPLARAAFAALRDELDRPRPGLAVMAGTLMKACVLLFIREMRHQGEHAPPSAAGHRIAAVAAAIRARPAEAYSIEGLAKLAGMSRATFARQFQRYAATTPMDYVLRTRLRDAAGLLRTTALPVKQVACETGFQSRSHFTRAFQAHFGMDPTRFRAARHGPEAAVAKDLFPMRPNRGDQDDHIGRGEAQTGVKKRSMRVPSDRPLRKGLRASVRGRDESSLT